MLGSNRGSGGNHSGIDMHRTGFCGLATRVQSLGLQNNEKIQVDFVVGKGSTFCAQ